VQTGAVPALIDRALGRLVALRGDERRALLWSFGYFFALLAGYYVLRPLRDEMGIAGGVKNLHWLFTATFFVMLAAVPIFGAVVARLPRQRFIPLVYHFFVLNIAIFWVLLTMKVETQTVARVFFVWISVFNLFAVSVFWSFMADLFTAEQGKRLFGFIAAGGSAGALTGPLVTVWLAGTIGPVNLLIVAALLLECAVICAHKLERALAGKAGEGPTRAFAQTPLGGNPFAGFALLVRSPYLLGIATWVLCLSIAGTFLYFQQANIVAAASDDPAVRTRMFASIDLAAGVLTLLVQVLVTGKLMMRFGAGPAVAFLPVVFAIGFAALAAAPVLVLVVMFQGLQRTANFAISNPAREVLFTAAEREEKYKAKYLIDGVVFRGGDALSGWLFNALRALGLELAAISLVAIPIAVVWAAVALALGRAHERKTSPLRNPSI
jgi:ATP:ADP antiporter, AAA family